MVVKQEADGSVFQSVALTANASETCFVYGRGVHGEHLGMHAQVFQFVELALCRQEILRSPLFAHFLCHYTFLFVIYSPLAIVAPSPTMLDGWVIATSFEGYNAKVSMHAAQHGPPSQRVCHRPIADITNNYQYAQQTPPPSSPASTPSSARSTLLLLLPLPRPPHPHTPFPHQPLLQNATPPLIKIHLLIQLMGKKANLKKGKEPREKGPIETLKIQLLRGEQKKTLKDFMRERLPKALQMKEIEEIDERQLRNLVLLLIEQPTTPFQWVVRVLEHCPLDEELRLNIATFCSKEQLIEEGLLLRLQGKLEMLL